MCKGQMMCPIIIQTWLDECRPVAAQYQLYCLQCHMVPVSYTTEFTKQLHITKPFYALQKLKAGLSAVFNQKRNWPAIAISQLSHKTRLMFTCSA